MAVYDDKRQTKKYTRKRDLIYMTKKESAYSTVYIQNNLFFLF